MYKTKNLPSANETSFSKDFSFKFFWHNAQFIQEMYVFTDTVTCATVEHHRESNGLTNIIIFL